MNRSAKYLLSALVLTTIGAYSLAWAHEDGVLKVTTVAKSTKAWDGEPLPAYPTGQPEITILRIVIPAGEKTPLHTHSVINAGVLLSGELVVHAEGGLTKTLKPGDPLIELVNKPHWGQNDGKVDAVILVFYAGVEGQTFTHIVDEHENHDAPAEK